MTSGAGKKKALFLSTVDSARAFSIITKSTRETKRCAVCGKLGVENDLIPRFGIGTPRISRFATPKKRRHGDVPVIRGTRDTPHGAGDTSRRRPLARIARTNAMPAVTSSIMRKRAAMPTSKPKKLGVMKLSEMDALAEKNAATGGASSRGRDARGRDPRDATSDALTLPTVHRYDAGSTAAPAEGHPATPSPTVRRSDTARVLRHPRPTPGIDFRRAKRRFFPSPTATADTERARRTPPRSRHPSTPGRNGP